MMEIRKFKNRHTGTIVTVKDNLCAQTFERSAAWAPVPEDNKKPAEKRPAKGKVTANAGKQG
jgi:hypothetical protein